MLNRMPLYSMKHGLDRNPNQHNAPEEGSRSGRSHRLSSTIHDRGLLRSGLVRTRLGHDRQLARQQQEADQPAQQYDLVHGSSLPGISIEEKESRAAIHLGGERGSDWKTRQRVAIRQRGRIGGAKATGHAVGGLDRIDQSRYCATHNSIMIQGVRSGTGQIPAHGVDDVRWRAGGSFHGGLVGIDAAHALRSCLWRRSIRVIAAGVIVARVIVLVCLWLA